MITNLLFETYWLAIAVGVIGLAIVAAGNRRVDAKTKWIGLGVVGLGLLLALVSHLVETDREQVLRRTRQFAAAIEARDWKTVESLLHPDVTLYSWHGPAEILKGGQRYAEQFGLQAVKLSSLRADHAGQQITASFNASAELTSSQFTGTIPTSWHFTWQKTAQGWQLRDATGASSFGVDIGGKFQGQP